jgi:hypothetical protein
MGIHFINYPSGSRKIPLGCEKKGNKNDKLPTMTGV